MSTPPKPLVRRVGLADGAAIGRLLHDFNREFDDPTPGPEWLAERVGRLLAGDPGLGGSSSPNRALEGTAP